MEAEYTAAYTRLYREHWWWRVRERILIRKIQQILNNGARDTRILDVGCGAALFFDALEKFGQVEGIESDVRAVEQSGRWRARIHVGELDSFKPGYRFDLVLMLDVLEHVQYPDQLFRRAADLLTPNGRILATVPAFDWLWTSHDDLNHHRNRYTAIQIRNLITDAGLTTVETSYLFQSLIFPKLLVRAKEALVSSAASVPKIPIPVLNVALQTWYALEYAIAGWLPFGSSVMAIAQRS
jgi:SAM-dependent methyltransferase